MPSTNAFNNSQDELFVQQFTNSPYLIHYSWLKHRKHCNMPASHPKIYYYHFFFFLGLHLWHMKVLKLGVKSELQLLAYATTTAIAMPDPSCICDLHHSSLQHQILNPLSKAGDQTPNLMVPSQICFCCATTRTPKNSFETAFFFFFSNL